MAFSESVVAEIGMACLLEVGLKSKWWRRAKYLCGLMVFVLGDCIMRELKVLNVDDSKEKVCKRVEKKVVLLQERESRLESIWGYKRVSERLEWVTLSMLRGIWK